jgi:hypothetical protein
MQTDDRDIEHLLETTDWEPAPDHARTQASLARLIARLDQRRHRMRMVARTSCALGIVALVMVTGTVWYRWTRPMVTAVHETQMIPAGVVRLVPAESGSAPSALQRALASLTGRDPRGLLTSVREVAGTRLLRAELASGTGHLLLLPGHGIVGIIASSSQSSSLTEGVVRIDPGEGPTLTAQDLATGEEIASRDASVAAVGGVVKAHVMTATVYQRVTPYPGGQQQKPALPYDPTVLYLSSGYIHLHRAVTIPLETGDLHAAGLSAVVDIDTQRVIAIVDTTTISGVILTDDPGPQVVLSEP